MTRRHSIWIAALLFGATIAAGARAVDQGSRTNPPRQDHTSAAYFYRSLCASCHGETGSGDGPASDLLRVRPPDLRQIARRAGGAFPAARVRQIIDGRTPLPGHMRSGMPVWGDVLRTTEGDDESAIARRIDGLVAHLESLQLTK
jgi:mono/diheme cytochrome c family protein